MVATLSLQGPKARNVYLPKICAAQPLQDQGSDLLKARNLFWPNIEPYRPRLAWRSRDESETRKRQDHLMNRGRRDFEVALEVRLCRWPTIHFRVRVDEGKILALQTRELGHLFVMSRRSTTGG